MTKGQIGQHRHLGVRPQPVHHALHVKALVMGREFVLRELPQHNGFLLGQYACMQQLRQHALNAIRMLAHIF